MAAGLLTPDPRLRELSDLGLILAGAKLNTYVAGTPSTPLASYSDEAGTTPNTNPVVASAGGLFGPIYLTLGVAYKLVLTDALNNPIWSQDNVKVPAAVNGVPASPSDATKFLNGAVTPAFAQVKDSDLSTSDIVTNDVSITKHGFAPKAPNDATKFLNGVGAYAVPVASLLTLLKANSGTDASVGATNVDTIAISGLTAKDQIVVELFCTSVTQQTADVNLFSTTDAINVASPGGAAAIVAGERLMATCTLMQSQASPTTYEGLSLSHSTAAGSRNNIVSGAAATAWTGSWTLALRHAGVTAGGTFQWRWAVYKLAGQ